MVGNHDIHEQEKAARDIRRKVDELNEAFRVAYRMGLSMDVNVSEVEEMSVYKGMPLISVDVWRNV